MIRRLKSDMFVADHSVGEDSLTKDIDFHGHDIDAQFSCLSTASSSVPELEIFGKVFVSLLDADGAEQDGTHFSFNLIKKVKQIGHNFFLNLYYLVFFICFIYYNKPADNHRNHL